MNYYGLFSVLTAFELTINIKIPKTNNSNSVHALGYHGNGNMPIVETTFQTYNEYVTNFDLLK